ncbi:MAG TPA: toll/interleukin-1 receptor domain-containing protein, partial [Myxococcales bacterium]
MSYDFFFSYRRADYDDYLKRFFENLCAAVCTRRGVDPKNGPPVGYRDMEEIPAGSDWNDELKQGLQSSKVFVAMLSPGYLSSPHCGREWAIFDMRRAQAARGGRLAPVLKPVLWFPPQREPSRISATQRFVLPVADSIYNQKGALFLLKRLNDHNTEYENLIDTLADQIVGDGDAAALPPLDALPAAASVAPAFAAPPPAGAVAPAPTTGKGPNHVRLIYVTVSPQDVGGARDPAPYLDEGGTDWKPFLPAEKTRVHVLLQGAVANARLDCDTHAVAFGADLEEQIQDAWQARNIVVLVVDGWSVQWNQEYRDRLKKIDGRLDYHWSVLVPRNKQDPDEEAARSRIAAALAEAFDR